MKKYLSVVLIFISLIISSCKKDNPIPPDEQPQINLTLEETSCTEAWIKLGTSNISLPANAEILKDDSITQTINLTTSDTVLYVDSLLPNHTYKFQSAIQSIGQSSNELNVTTMDTTSHVFTWQTWTFGGQAGSCTLYDVAIINENNIWAVGEIYLLDSIGVPDPQAYGIAKWDGQTWELKKLFYNNNIPVTPRGILVISPNDIYLASGSIFHWDGVSSTVQIVYSRLNLPDPNAMVEKLWGNSEMLYGVGNAGTIVTYQNGQWSRIESGTNVDLLDISGDTNGETIFIAGYKDLNPTVLLKLQNFNVEKIIEDKDNLFNYITDFISGAIFSIWSDNKNLYALTWYDLYRADYNTKGNAVALWKGDPQDWDAVSVRGNRSNDIITCGVISKIWHYNGVSWNTYNELINTNDRLKRIEIRGDITVAVGYRYESGIQNQGLIILGRR
jgi:hypothetical protein